MSGHGGARRGAGRPRKWCFEDVLTIGQACEVKWREAAKAAFESERERLFSEVSDIQSLWDAAQCVPVRERRRWLTSEKFEQHRADVETELHALHGTRDDLGAPRRGVHIAARPPRGTRKRIIGEVAEQFSLRESAVDSLWQEYRRFERELGEYVVT